MTTLQEIAGQLQPEHGNQFAIWVHKEVNVRYFSGFTGDSSELLWTPQDMYLVTDARYTTQATEECAACTVVNHRGNVLATIRELCEQQNIRTLFLEKEEISARSYERLLDLWPGVGCIDISLDSARQIKSEEELDCIRRASRIADASLQSIMTLLQPGRREAEIRVALEKAMLDHGSERPAFETIVASGKRSALPHGVASAKELAVGDFLTIDFGAVYRGYHSDMTRTFVIGRASAKQKDMYDAVLGAQQRAIEAIAIGKPCRDIDEVARNYLRERGYGEYFTHSLGHGVGLEIHEQPTFSPRAADMLQAFQVITVEPGIYIPEYGGLRIEDAVIVREDTPEILTLFPKQLIEIEVGDFV